MKTKISTLVLSLLLLGTVQSTLAQRPAGMQAMPGAQGTIVGTVIEAETNEGIPSATVAVWSQADSSLVTGTITQIDGTFEIDGLRPGAYFVRFSYVGLKTENVSGISLGRDGLLADLGTVKLQSDSQQLEGIDIEAERDFVEVGIDRTVYNTKDQLVSAGGDASNVLENIPSVEVDIDGNVSLRGNQNVAIMINGRPSPMTGEALVSYLQGLPAENVERVEVIPNPSAKYEPDGMAGILNIVLRKDVDMGLSGGLNLSSATQGRHNTSANVGYQKGALTAYSSYSFRYGNRDGESYRFRENRFSEPYTYLDQQSFDDNLGLSHNFNTSLDYRLSSLNTLSFSALVSRRGGDRDQLNVYAESLSDELLTGRFDRYNLGERSDLNTDYRLSFSRVREAGKNELNAELRYGREWEDDLGSYRQEAFDLIDLNDGTIVEEQRDSQDEENTELSLQVDYVRPLGSETKLEAGFKSEVDELSSDFFSETYDAELQTYTPDVELINAFQYDQQIHAAYGIVGTSVGKFSLQGGLRLEQALTSFDLRTTGESFENNYFSAFPSAFLVYQFSDASSVKLSYSKRINRPRTRQLNPFTSSDDPYFRRSGNPYLKPEYVHAFELSLTQFTNATSVTVTPYYRHTVDVIRFFEQLTPSGVSLLTFENLDTSTSWGVELIGTYKLGRRLNALASFNAFKVVTDGSNVDTGLSNNAFGFSTRANTTLNITETLDLQASYFYRAPMKIENGHMDAFQSADIALRKKLFEDRANLSLRFSDIFGTMGFSMWRNDPSFYMEMDRSFQAQGVSLSFNYNFGKKQRIQRRNRDEGGMDEGMDEMQMQ